MTEEAIRVVLCFLLACVPAYIWGYIFYHKQPEPRKWVILTFLAGMFSVLPIMLYKYSWTYFPNLNFFVFSDQFDADILGFSDMIFLPVGIVLAFMFVGVIEEYMKNIVVRVTDHNHLESIDDAIEFCIIAALGFAFVENIMYFFYIWTYQGFDSLFISFIFRSVFSTFAHIFFSGIYGYYYGVAHFAKPILQEELREKRHPILQAFHKVTHLRSSSIFAEEKILEGLIIAVVLHAGFNIFLEIGWTFIIVPYLVLGYGMLSYLMKLKNNHKNYNKVLVFNKD
jgi:RsiW-degrading membrane proteinase PrsW (M82 family)